MECYKAALEIKKDKVGVFLGLHLSNPTQKSKDIFDFLLIQQTKEIVQFLRKNKTKYPNMHNSVDSFFNEGFSSEYIEWLLFDKKLPDTSNTYDYSKAINRPMDRKVPIQIDLSQILENGSERTIAELILKSAVLLSQSPKAPKTNMKITPIQQQLEDYNILYDQRILMTNYTSSVISADQKVIYNLLENLVNEELLGKIMQNLNFVNKYSFGVVSAFKIATRDLKNNQLQIIPIEVIKKLSQVGDEDINNFPQVFCEFLSVVSYGPCFFSPELLKFQRFSVNQLLISLYNKPFMKAKKQILDIFTTKEYNFFYSTISPQLILEMSISKFPNDNLPKLLCLRTYQDGPLFLNEFLQASMEQINHIQPELIHFIYEFSSKVIWLGSMSEFFQSKCCRNTSKLFGEFKQNCITQFGNYGIPPPSCSNSKMLQRVKNLMFLISRVNLAKIQQHITKLNDFHEIIQEVIIEASQVFADQKQNFQQRIKYLVLVIELLDQYDSIKQHHSCAMEESGWYHTVMLRLLNTIQDFEASQENWIELKALILESNYLRSKPYLYHIISDVAMVQNSIKPVYDPQQFEGLCTNQRHVVRTEPTEVEEDFKLFDMPLFAGFSDQGIWQMTSNSGKEEFFFKYYTKFNAKNFKFNLVGELRLSQCQIVKVNFISQELMFIYYSYDSLTLFQLKISGTTKETTQYKSISKIVNVVFSYLQEQLIIQDRQGRVKVVNFVNLIIGKTLMTMNTYITSITSKSKYILIFGKIQSYNQLILLHDNNVFIKLKLESTPTACVIVNPEAHSSQLKIVIAYNTGVVEIRHLITLKLLLQVTIEVNEITHLAIIEKELIYQKSDSKQIHNLGKLLSSDLL